MLGAPAMPEKARDARNDPEPHPAGTRGATGARRGARRQRTAGFLHRRAAGDGREGKQGPGPGRARQLRFRPSVRAHHGQSRAGRPAEGRWPIRPADCGRDPRGFSPVAARALRQDRALRRAVAGRRPACDSRRTPDRAAGHSRRAYADTAERQHGGSHPGASRAHPWRTTPARRLQVRDGACSHSPRPASPQRRPTQHLGRTSPTFAGRRTPDAHSKSQQRESTACCSSARPERARACSRSACRGSWRR